MLTCPLSLMTFITLTCRDSDGSGHLSLDYLSPTSIGIPPQLDFPYINPSPYSIFTTGSNSTTEVVILHWPSSHAFRQLHSSVMPLPWRRALPGLSWSAQSTGRQIHVQSRWILWAVFTICLTFVSAMTPVRIAELRQETVEMFYHGFDNYMDVAFPEDEVRFPPSMRYALCELGSLLY